MMNRNSSLMTLELLIAVWDFGRLLLRASELRRSASHGTTPRRSAFHLDFERERKESSDQHDQTQNRDTFQSLRDSNRLDQVTSNQYFQTQ